MKKFFFRNYIVRIKQCTLDTTYKPIIAANR